MNLIVRTKIKEGYDPEGTIVELINALHLVAAVHPDFKGEVHVSVENEGSPTEVNLKIESVGINWQVGFFGVYKEWNMLDLVPHEEAKTRIRELTSPKVDQPAPDEPKAAEIKWRDWKNVLGGATRISTCGNYTLERQMVGGTSAYFTGCDRRDLVAESSSGMAEAALYPACQAHKQRRLNDLL